MGIDFGLRFAKCRDAVEQLLEAAILEGDAQAAFDALAERGVFAADKEIEGHVIVQEDGFFDRQVFRRTHALLMKGFIHAARQVVEAPRAQHREQVFVGNRRDDREVVDA